MCVCMCTGTHTHSHTLTSAVMLSLVRSAVYEDVHTGQIARYNQQFNRYPACSARCKVRLLIF